MILSRLDTELELPEHGGGGALGNARGSQYRGPRGQGGWFGLLELVSEGAVAAPGLLPVKTDARSCFSLSRHLAS